MIDSMVRDSFTSKKVLTIKVVSPTVRQQYKDAIYLIMDAFTKVKFKTAKRMAKAPILIPFKIISIQACGRKINPTGKENRNSEMGRIMKEISREELSKDTDITFANLEYTKVNFPRVILMGREHLAIQTDGLTKESGCRVSLLAMEYLLGLMGTGMKDSTRRD